MTVNPGWGGQPFLEASPARIERLRALVGPGTVIEVDGGIGAERRRAARRAGATLFVAGSAVFGSRRSGGRGARDRGRSGSSGVTLGEPATPTGTASRTVGRSGRDHTVAVGPRVLIVDDHPSFRASARVLLEAEGFDVVGEAADGAQAITEAGRLRPEVVLLDVQLPDIDGFDVAARLTGDADSPTVILVSSRDGSDFGPLVTRSERAVSSPKPSSRAIASKSCSPDLRPHPLGCDLMSSLPRRGRR